MSRVGKFLVLCCLCALVVVAAGQSGTTASHRGGTLKLDAKAAGGTLDPQVNYTLEYWQLYQGVYDGLLAFKKVGGDGAFTVVPDLAQNLPTPTNGGKTWVF
jgi:peptide/nickel transport system substrate-binding protein